jgi:hypothetical protein
LDVNLDHETVWAFDNTGRIQLISEVSCRVPPELGGHWSLVDFFIDLDSTVRLVHEMWRTFGHFGAGQFDVDLSVRNFPPLLDNVSPLVYSPHFYGLNFRIPVAAARKTNSGGSASKSDGKAEAFLDYDARTARRAESLANLGNQVLRDLRFDVEVTKLHEALMHMPHS